VNKSISSWVAALCGAVVMVLSVSAASAERRVALVVGNSQYKNSNLVLFNPRRDAQDVAATLRSLGFEVILTLDASKRDFDVAMTGFARAAIDADAALFYYAGHALQYQGQNYLMPTDADLEDEISVRYQTVSLDDVRAGLDHAAGVKIMILDACRNNPVADGLSRRTTSLARNAEQVRGLARIDKAQGTVVIYATAADQVAADGSGRNSPFTAALLKRMREAGVEIGTMFRRVAADVIQQTNGRQRPELVISLTDEYYLNQNDRPVWERIKDTADLAAFRDFIDRFPSSSRASDAQYRLTILERDQLARESAAQGREQGPATKAEAEAERQKQQLTLVPPIALPTNLQPASMTQEQACKRDEEKLARLRATQVRDEVVRFARELGCERLRPQLLRLLESVSPEWERDGHKAPQPAQARELGPAADAGPQVTPSLLSQEQICKRDQERLTRLRASQVPDEVIRFEHELGCERLRPQVMRLRESLGAN
jgi:uncharacterized caspase-like protein